MISRRCLRQRLSDMLEIYRCPDTALSGDFQRKSFCGIVKGMPPRPCRPATRLGVLALETVPMKSS